MLGTMILLGVGGLGWGVGRGRKWRQAQKVAGVKPGGIKGGMHQCARAARLCHSVRNMSSIGGGIGRR